MMYSLPDTVYTLPLLYKDTFFSEDSLWHPELSVSPVGIQATIQPFAIFKDDYLVITAILLGTLAIALYRSCRLFLKQQTKNFFLPLSNQRSNDLYDISRPTTILFALLLVLSGTILCFYCRQDSYNFCTYREIWYMMAQIAFFGISYFLFKSFLLRFVDWTFFHKEQRVEWQKNYAFLLALEALAITPILLVSISIRLTPTIAFLCVVLVILAAKIPLLYKCKTIFFPNFYGYLHLIVYFCGVELGPMAILWVALSCSELLFF